MRSAVYTIPKGLKQINEHCTSFLFLITYYNFGLLLLWQKLDALRVQTEQYLTNCTKKLYLLFFIRLLICLDSQMTVKLKITTKWTLKMLKLGMVSSFHPHSMCKKVQGLTAKTGCPSCTKQTISFEVSGFHTETHLLQRDFISPPCFCVFKMHHSKPHRQFSTLSDFICYFSCIYWFFWAIWPWSWKALQMNSEKVRCWHGIIISPT